MIWSLVSFVTLCALGVLWWFFQSSDMMKNIRRMNESLRTLKARAAGARRIRLDAESALARQARSYVDWDRQVKRAQIPIGRLREAGAVNVRWSGLDGAGIRTLTDLSRASRSFLESLPGIGEASASKIMAAAAAFEESIQKSPVRLPPRRPQEGATLALAKCALLAATANHLVKNGPEVVEKRASELGATASAIGRRATFFNWVGDVSGDGPATAVTRESALLTEEIHQVLEGESVQQIRTAETLFREAEGALAKTSEVIRLFEERYVELCSLITAVLRHDRVQAADSFAEIQVQDIPVAEVRSAAADREPVVPSAPAAGFSSSPSRPFRAQVPPAGDDATWISEGRRIEIAGVSVPGGLIYVGKHLSAVSDHTRPDPALIDPSLKVNVSNPAHDGAGMPYWPSYSEISPEQRGAYLEWLAGGRKDPDVYIGYVFLFFYGLERRMLLDASSSASARAETPVILAELERLLSIYGRHGSFWKYAEGFMGLLRAGDPNIPPSPPATFGSPGWDGVPMSIRLGLGRLVASGRKIPPDWALAWIRCDPTADLRTPAKRCATEFDELFKIRYARTFGAGMLINAPKSHLRVDYRPASNSFSREFSGESTRIPDVTSLQGPINRLKTIAEECATGLEAFSRFVGRAPEARSSMLALALLPADLLKSESRAEVREFETWLGERVRGNEVASSASTDLLARWNRGAADSLDKAESRALGQFLGHLGFGIEPDVRFGGPSLESNGTVLLFRLGDDAPQEPSPSYLAAAVVARVASLIIGADGNGVEAERAELIRRATALLELTSAEAARLDAHVQWLLANPPGQSGLRKRLEDLDPALRGHVGTLLVQISCADGSVSPAEIEMLVRTFSLLGLDPATVYSQVHERTGRATDTSDEPVLISRGQRSETKYRIPPPPTKRERAVPIDMAAVRRKVAESEQVFGLLRNIFEEPEAPKPAPRVQEVSSVSGMDSKHGALLRRMAEKQKWARTEFEVLAGELGLMPDGALETLNEVSFDRTGERLCDGDDPIEIDQEILKRLCA